MSQKDDPNAIAFEKMLGIDVLQKLGLNSDEDMENA